MIYNSIAVSLCLIFNKETTAIELHFSNIRSLKMQESRSKTNESQRETGSNKEEISSRTKIMAIVTLAFFLDTMLFSVIVPIIPDILHNLDVSDTKTIQGEISDESVKIGILLASKAVVQLLVNPCIGYLSGRVGYKTPLLSGFLILCVSTLAFAIESSYAFLFFARAFQGIGSACVSVSGLAVLAQSFPDYDERTKAMGIALTVGWAFGITFAPTFGGFMYEFVGKSSAFLVLALIAFIGIILQMCITYPAVNHTRKQSSSLFHLLQDPCILTAAGSIMVSNIVYGMLDTCIPIIVKERMELDSAQTGASFLPCSLFYMIGTFSFGRIASCIGRWLTCILGLFLMGSASVSFMFIYKPEVLIIPMALTGLAIGMVDASMFPELGNLADLRHTVTYGVVYSIGDISVCLGLAVGPAMSGWLIDRIGFNWMVVVTSITCLVYAPLLFIIKKPKPRTHEDENENTLLSTHP